ncbi:MAG: response regulator [Lysobacteraceae bacterium]
MNPSSETPARRVIMVVGTPMQVSSRSHALRESLGVETLGFEDSEEALRAAGSLTRLDAVVQNHIREMNGWVFARRLRREYGFLGPIISMTACEFDDADLQWSARCGITQVLSGIDMRTCIQLLETCFNSEPANPPQTAPHHPDGKPDST